MNRALIAATQSNFCQRHFAPLLKVVYVLIVIAFCLTSFLFYQHFNKPKQQYFITTTDGRLIEIMPASS